MQADPAHAVQQELAQRLVRGPALHGRVHVRLRSSLVDRQTHDGSPYRAQCDRSWRSAMLVRRTAGMADAATCLFSSSGAPGHDLLNGRGGILDRARGRLFSQHCVRVLVTQLGLRLVPVWALVLLWDLRGYRGEDTANLFAPEIGVRHVRDAWVVQGLLHCREIV